LGEQWSEGFWEFRSIMYSHNNPTGTFASFMLFWGQVSPGFLGYVKRQWANQLQNWAVFFQTVIPHLNLKICLTADIVLCSAANLHIQTNHQGVHTKVTITPIRGTGY
jgi:hypothetical protein